MMRGDIPHHLAESSGPKPPELGPSPRGHDVARGAAVVGFFGDGNPVALGDNNASAALWRGSARRVYVQPLSIGRIEPNPDSRCKLLE